MTSRIEKNKGIKSLVWCSVKVEKRSLHFFYSTHSIFFYSLDISKLTPSKYTKCIHTYISTSSNMTRGKKVKMRREEEEDDGTYRKCLCVYIFTTWLDSMHHHHSHFCLAIPSACNIICRTNRVKQLGSIIILLEYVTSANAMSRLFCIMIIITSSSVVYTQQCIVAA